MLDDLDDWFVREVLPHEAALLRYLARAWPDLSEIEDIRHDAYVRILESAHRLRSTAPKSLLFSIARNLMIDRVRRHRVVSMNLFESLEDLEALNVLIDEVTPERRAIVHQQTAEVGEAINSLPARCREVLWLRRIENLSQKEIAARLGMCEGTVEKHMARAARLLAALLNVPDRSAAATTKCELARDIRHGG